MGKIVYHGEKYEVIDKFMLNCANMLKLEKDGKFFVGTGYNRENFQMFFPFLSKEDADNFFLRKIVSSVDFYKKYQ